MITSISLKLRKSEDEYFSGFHNTTWLFMSLEARRIIELVKHDYYNQDCCSKGMKTHLCFLVVSTCVGCQEIT